MKDHDRGNDWQIFGAVALIALGVVLFLNQTGGPWWGMARDAFRDAVSVGWPLAVIGLGVLLLISARGGGLGIGTAGKRLYRSRSERMIGGVLGGLADYLGGVDPTWLRIAYVILAVITGFGPAIGVYIIAMIVIPEEPKTAPQAPSWPHAPSAPPQQSPDWAQQAPGSTETVQAPPPPAPPAPPQG